LSMALRTAVPVEGWTEAHSRFASDAAGNRIHFLKTKLSLIKKRLLIRVKSWIKTSGSRRARARTRIALSMNGRNNDG
jgi:hypothetical protein